tara:strand:- start:844 stop:2325 length:1482 start_codon:yes stop_codon:yes gene_type:complete
LDKKKEDKMIKFEVINKHAVTHPDKIALDDGRDKITWKLFAELTNNIAGLLSEQLKSDSDFTAIFISRNSMDLVVVGAAMSTLAIPFQGVDYHLDLTTIKTIVSKMNVSHVFLAKEFEDKFEALSSCCQVVMMSDVMYMASQLKFDNPRNRLQSQTAFRSYSFTSGTTGIPKVAFRTTSFDKRRFDYLTDRYDFKSSDVHLTCLPMYHVSATGWMRLFLSLGSTVVIHNYVNSYDLCEILHSKDITTTIMSPFMLKGIVEDINVDTAFDYFKSLRFLITGGKNCTVKLKNNAMTKLGPIIYEYYGTTETGVNTLLDPHEAFQYPESVGKSYDGNSVQIIDECNKPLATNEIGRIAIHSYMNMDCYLNAEAEFIHIDGLKYLVTSDYGFKSPKDYLYLVQRSNKESIKPNNLIGIENAVTRLPCVSDAYVYQNTADSSFHIDVVLNYYRPYQEIDELIQKISSDKGVKKVHTTVTACLDYTPTGKIKLPLSIAI